MTTFVTFERGNMPPALVNSDRVEYVEPRQGDRCILHLGSGNTVHVACSFEDAYFLLYSGLTKEEYEARERSRRCSLPDVKNVPLESKE